MIIDSSYFVRNLALPQVGNPEGLIAVNAFIAKYEPQFLECALGFDLAQAFADGIEDSLPEQRWVDLLEGADYSWKGRNNRWEGFENAAKLSPIANYVFYQFVDNKASTFALTGHIVSQTENNRTVNGVDRLVDTWNEMVDFNTRLMHFLRANKANYPEWRECNHQWLTHYWWYNNCHVDSCQYSGCKDNVFRKKNTFDL